MDWCVSGTRSRRPGCPPTGWWRPAWRTSRRTARTTRSSLSSPPPAARWERVQQGKSCNCGAAGGSFLAPQESFPPVHTYLQTPVQVTTQSRKILHKYRDLYLAVQGKQKNLFAQTIYIISHQSLTCGDNFPKNIIVAAWLQVSEAESEPACPWSDRGPARCSDTE